MKSIRFEPPVGIHFGKQDQTLLVRSLREAADCMMSNDWPLPRTPSVERAMRVFIAAAEGRRSAADARSAFSAAAGEDGILITMH